MPERGDLARPEVRSPTCLHPYKTGRKSGEKRRDLVPA
jgi:hypothetical protein